MGLDASDVRERLEKRIVELEAALTIAHKWMGPGVRSIPVGDRLREMHERELRQVEAAMPQLDQQ